MQYNCTYRKPICQEVYSDGSNRQGIELSNAVSWPIPEAYLASGPYHLSGSNLSTSVDAYQILSQQ